MSDGVAEECTAPPFTPAQLEWIDRAVASHAVTTPASNAAGPSNVVTAALVTPAPAADCERC